MMEEVSDDTNGESSFEFISGKIEDSSLKDNGTSSPSSNILPSTSADTQNLEVASLASSSAAGYLSTVTAIPFYDPKNIALPPSFTQPAIHIPQSEGTPAPPIQYSALHLPLEVPPEKQPEGTGVWGWLKGKEFLNKVAEKAKNSVDSVITTLDPGMKEIINSGGDVHAVVASDIDDEVSAVREAFQAAFGKATVQGICVGAESIAPQPVGFSAGLKAAEERVRLLRQMGFAGEHVVFVAHQNFLAEFTPDNHRMRSPLVVIGWVVISVAALSLALPKLSRPKVWGTAVPPQELDPSFNSTRRKIVLIHNYFRTRVRPRAADMLEMSWHEEAAEDAQRWAESCQLLVHDNATGRWTKDYGTCGQNIFVANVQVPWFFAAKVWFMERLNFTYGQDSNDPNVVGHYTQWQPPRDL